MDDGRDVHRTHARLDGIDSLAREQRGGKRQQIGGQHNGERQQNEELVLKKVLCQALDNGNARAAGLGLFRKGTDISHASIQRKHLPSVIH